MSDILASLAAALAVIGCRYLFIQARRHVQGRQLLRRLDVGTERATRERKPLLEGFARTFGQTRGGMILRDYAESHHPSRPFSDVVALLLIGMLAGAIAGWMLFGTALLTVLSAIAGPITMGRIAARFESRRAVEIEQALPDALDLQAAALRAGNSTVGSLRVLEREIGSPLGDEVRKLLHAIDLGTPVEQALQELAARGQQEIGTWVTAIQIHRQTGGNLPVILESLSTRLRERARMRGEVRALTAQARLSGLVVSVAPIVFLLIMFAASRDEMRLVFTSPQGIGLLAIGLSLQAAGLIWIRSILKVKI